MSLNYTTYTSQLANLMAAVSSDPNFITFEPGCIDYAEQRIYRELNLVNTYVRDSTGNLTANSRTFNLPNSVGTFVVVQDVNVVSPSSLNLTTGGVRNPLAPCSLEILDFLYPGESAPATPSVPSLWAVLNSSAIAVGPAPDAAYQVEVVGTIRPTPLSSNNSSTFLTTNLPDLFMAASMVFASGYMRDFGQQADNPQMGASWESQYQKLFQSAAQEEIRKKYNRTFNAVYNPAPAEGGTV